uniref:hypothetical protein 37 n=1 Tax=Moniliophthora perniciosa TaxID=153609 RepID=UPI0000242384|nr:hypothetical protein 37 [Moniliophthora perniciosa]AAQ74327.1 hypothetical protein 37 [Moniliophthora perniciosa]
MTIKIFINLYLISIFIIFHNIINKNYTCAAPTITILIKIILFFFQMFGMFSFPAFLLFLRLLAPLPFAKLREGEGKERRKLKFKLKKYKYSLKDKLKLYIVIYKCYIFM